EARGDWSAAQKTLALDLLGTPPELRDGPTQLDPESGQGPQAHRAALVAAEIERLRTLQETVLNPRDAREQLAAELGLDAPAPPPLSFSGRSRPPSRPGSPGARTQPQPGKFPRPRPAPAPPPTPTPEPMPPPPPPPFDARLVEEPAADEEGMFGFDK